MRLILQFLVLLALIPTDAYSANKSDKVEVKGKVVKQVVVRNNKGQKQKCQIVLDTKTKKKVTVCTPLDDRYKKAR